MNTEDNWENLKYFIALAREGKLVNAAELLGSNHSTIYRKIRQFEDQYKMTLFERTPSGYYLTPQGEELYKKVEDLDFHMNSVFASIQGLENTLSGEVCITTTPSIAMSYFPHLQKAIHKKWPNVTLDLRISNSFFNLSRREADIAIRPSIHVPDHLIGRKVAALNFGVFGRNRLKIENSLDHIFKRNFIGLSDSLSHLLSSKWLNSKISSQQMKCQVDDLVTMANICESGDLLAVLPLYFQETFPKLKLLHTPSEYIGSDLWILTHKNMQQIPKIKACSKFIYEELSRLTKKYSFS